MHVLVIDRGNYNQAQQVRASSDSVFTLTYFANNRKDEAKHDIEEQEGVCQIVPIPVPAPCHANGSMQYFWCGVVIPLPTTRRCGWSKQCSAAPCVYGSLDLQLWELSAGSFQQVSEPTRALEVLSNS